MGLEPTFSPWKGDIIALIRYPLNIGRESKNALELFEIIPEYLPLIKAFNLSLSTFINEYKYNKKSSLVVQL